MFTLFEMYQQPLGFLMALLVLSLWTVVWNGFGLWHSARNGQNGWFIAILVLNTAGLLPIIYLLWFRPQEKKSAVNSDVKPAAKKTARKTAKK